MEMVVLAASPGSDLLAEWRERAADAGLQLHLQVCESPASADEAVSKAIQREAEDAGAFLEFCAGDGLHYLRQADIVFLRSSGHHAEIGLAEGRVLCSKTLRIPTLTLLRPYMEGGRFLQTARAAFVNMAYVKAVTREGVVLTTGRIFPITHHHYKALLAENGGKRRPPCGTV